VSTKTASERQKALLAYVITVAKQARDFNSIEDFTDRIIKCVYEDIESVAVGFVKYVVQERGADVIGSVAKSAASLFFNKLNKK